MNNYWLQHTRLQLLFPTLSFQLTDFIVPLNWEL